MNENVKDHLTVLTEAEFIEDRDHFFDLYEQYIEEENDSGRIGHLKSGQAYRDIPAAFMRQERPCQLFWISGKKGFLIICHENTYIRLADLFVVRAERGKGLGERALRELTGLFPHQPIRLTPSAKAKSLYRRCGFTETEDFYEDNGQRIWQRLPSHG